MQRLANKATYVGPLGACVGRECGVEVQRGNGAVNVDVTENPIYDENGIGNREVREWHELPRDARPTDTRAESGRARSSNWQG